MQKSQRKNPKQVGLSKDNEELFVQVLSLHLEVLRERLSDKEFINLCFTKGIMKHREDLLKLKSERKEV